MIVPDRETRTIDNMMNRYFVLMRLSLVATGLALLAACSAMLIGGGNQGSPAIGSEHRSSEQVAGDNALAATLRGAFAADSLLRSERLSVSVSSAVATLSGAVGSYEARDHALEVARNVAGISRVTSQLQVNTNH